MGKLAQRYEDADRSGVYRVAGARVALEAASEANAQVLELGVDEIHALAGRLSGLEQDARPCVVLIADGARLAQHSALLDVLHELARGFRRDMRPFFAVLVDPDGALHLPALYKEVSARSAR